MTEIPPAHMSPVKSFSDLRGAEHDNKRTTDRKKKWQYGSYVPERYNYSTDTFIKQGKARPQKGGIPCRNKDIFPRLPNNPRKSLGRRWIDDRQSPRVKCILSAWEELSDPLIVDAAAAPHPNLDELKISGNHFRPRSGSVAGNSANTPQRIAPLGDFIKETRDRDIEREFQVVDGQGEIVKGFNLRRELRQAKRNADDIDRDGFVFV